MPINYAAALAPVPDVEFDFLRIKIKRGRNSGVFGAEVSAVTSTTITVANAYWTTNQWAGYDCSIIAADVGYDLCPWWNFRVVSNTSDTLTVNAAFSPAPDDVIHFTTGTERWLLVMRTKPTTITASTIEEPNFDNSLALRAALPVADATNASPIVVEVTGHPYVTGDRARLDYVEGNTAANGVWTVTVIDADHFSLNGSTGSGAYTGGGTARQLTGGLDPDEAKGKLLRIIAGKGRGAVYKIKANTGTVITIDGAWIETPDSTTRFITEEPNWLREVDSTPANVSTFVPTLVPEYPVDLAGHVRVPLIAVLIPVDGGGNEAYEAASQVRDFYLFRDLGEPKDSFQSALNLTVSGTLAIGSDQASRISLAREAPAVAVRAEVKTAPTGAAITVKILVGGTAWITLVIADGTTSISATEAQLASATPIGAGQNIRIDVETAGTTFPGADLSVSLYL